MSLISRQRVREALFRAKHILEKSLKDFGNGRMGGSLAARTGHKSNLLNSFFFHPIRQLGKLQARRRAAENRIELMRRPSRVTL
jgi:hypothetical protein